MEVRQHLKEGSRAAQWLVLSAAWLVLGAVIGWNLYAEYIGIDTLERDRLTQQARVIDKNLGYQLRATSVALDSIRADLPELMARGKGQVNQRLKAMSDAMPGVRTLLVLDREGTATASNREELIGRDFREREYFQTALKSGNPDILHLSPPYKTVLGVFAMNLVKVVTDAGKRFDGVIVATLDPEYFNILLESVRYAPDAWSSLAHGDGKLFLMIPARPGVDETDLAKPGSFYMRHRDSRQSATVMTGIVHATGEESMMAQRTIQPAEISMDKALLVAVARDLRSIFTPWREDAWELGAVFALLVVSSAGMLVFYQRTQRSYAQLAARQEAERKKLEREREQFMRFFLLSIDPMCIADPFGCFRQVNPAFTKLTGYAESELLSKPFLDFILPEDRQRTADEMKQQVEIRPSLNFANRYLCKDGSVVLLSWNAYFDKLDGVTYATARDITATSLAEEQIRRLAQMVNAAPNSIVVHDFDGRFLYANRRSFELHGYSREEFLALNLRQLDVPGDAALIATRMAELREHGEAFFEVEHYRKDGSTLPLEVSIKTTTWGGEPAILSISTDITAHKRAQALLQESEERFRVIFEGAPDAIILADPQTGMILDANQTACRLLGRERAAIVGTHQSGLHPPSSGDRSHQIFTRHVDESRSAGFTHPIEDALLRPDGSEVPVEILAQMIPLQDQIVLMGTFRDITERKRIESALRESEARFRQMFERNETVMLLIDPDSAAIVEANPAAARFYGYSVEVLRTMRIDQINTLSADEIAARRAQALHHESNQFLFPHRLASGAVRTVEVRSSPLEVDSRIVLFSLVQDVTDRELMTEELKRSNAELEQFSYAISHDMRQPLRMISSYMQLLEQGLSGKIDSEQREFFDFAIDGAKRLDQMLVGLLDYSRVGRKGDPPGWVESRAILDEVLLFLQPALNEVQARLAVTGEWPRVFVSRNEVLRLMLNLVDNAIKFRVAGRTPEIAVSSAVVADCWRLCVADNGVGILPDQIGRLFQVFQRLQSRAVYEGTGIGLALCRKIAEHYGGRIWAESSGAGKGSLFCVELPSHGLAPEAPSANEPE